MAELSEADKRTILGENYREALAKAQAEGRAQTAPRLIWESQVAKCDKNKFSAFALMVVGAILVVSNFYAVSGPSVVLVDVFGMVAFVAGAGWYVHTWTTLRKLRANRPTD